MSNIYLTEIQFKKFCKHLLESIEETAKIRPFTNDDYKNANPSQIDLNLDDMTKLRDMDDEYKKRYNKKKVNIAKDLYSEPNIHHPCP